MSEITLKENSSITDEVYDSQIIKSNFIKTLNRHSNEIVSNLANLISYTRQLRQNIDPNKKYFAQFSKEMTEKMNSGQWDFMRTKSGEILSNLIDKTSPKNIVHNLKLSELDPNMIDKVQKISSNVMNMALQQQLAQVSEELSEIKIIIASIKRGQITDRIAKVYSGKRQLENALEGPLELKIGSILNAIQSLEEGRTQLEYTLKEDIKKLKNIPPSKFKIFFKFLSDDKFYETCETVYYNFQESFHAYIEASQCLSMAYNEINNENAMFETFEPVKSLILESSQKMMLLSSIVIKGKNEDSLMWYKNTEHILKTLDNYSKKTSLNAAEMITIEIEGSKLLGEE